MVRCMSPAIFRISDLFTVERETLDYSNPVDLNIHKIIIDSLV